MRLAMVFQSEVNIVFSVRHGQFGVASSQLLASVMTGCVMLKTQDICPVSSLADEGSVKRNSEGVRW